MEGENWRVARNWNLRVW